MPVVSTIHNEVRALLNDVGNTLFTDAVLLPFTKKAYQELQDELTSNGIADTIEESATFISVNAGDKTITLPNDLIQPLEVWERGVGQTDSDWVKMTERTIDPSWMPNESLDYWEWRESEVKLVGATTNREVKIRYVKFTTVINNENSVIPFMNCQTYLAARCAAIAALVIGGNPDRATIYDGDATIALTKIINVAVKRNQGQPTRRIPFRARK